MTGRIDIGRKFVSSSSSLFLNMWNILALLRDFGKSPVAWGLFIKLDSIGAWILMLDLRIVVGLLSQPTLLLCLMFVIILVISGIDDAWKFSASGI